MLHNRNLNLLKIETKKSDLRDPLNSMDNTDKIATTSSLCLQAEKGKSAQCDATSEQQNYIEECITPVFSFTDNERSQDN